MRLKLQKFCDLIHRQVITRTDPECNLWLVVGLQVWQQIEFEYNLTLEHLELFRSFLRDQEGGTGDVLDAKVILHNDQLFLFGIINYDSCGTCTLKLSYSGYEGAVLVTINQNNFSLNTYVR